jgi:hypothetical protein
MGLFDFDAKKMAIKTLFPFIEEHIGNGTVVAFFSSMKENFKCKENESIEILLTTEVDCEERAIIMVNVVALSDELKIRVLKQFTISEIFELIKKNV